MTEYNYQTIKKLAKGTGVLVESLIVLAPNNDPFYFGKKSDVEKAEWFKKLWDATGYSKTHLRMVFYWAVSQKTKIRLPHSISTKDKKTGKIIKITEFIHDQNGRCWAYLQEASKAARYLGLIPINAIDDARNPDPHINTYYHVYSPSYSIDIPELDNPSINISGINVTNVQPYHLEVWCEKSTMDKVLLPVCQKYHTNLVTFEGEASITGVVIDLIQRINESGRKPTRIFYISDFDPAGNSMPAAVARKLEWYLRNKTNGEYDVRLKPIALTLIQVEKYNLPRMPIEKDAKRAGNFEAAFGEGAVELDALEAIYPGELAKIIDEALSEYYHQDAEDEAEQNEQNLENDIKEKIQEITAKYQKEINILEKMNQEISNIDVDVNEYTVDSYEPNVEETNDWLFNSKRDYLKQLSHYKKHKGIDPVITLEKENEDF